LGAPAVSITSARADIRERLLAHGFTEEFLGVDDPPATHYHLRDEASGFYAEFLTPLTGSSTDRKGQRKATLEIAGVTTQQLRQVLFGDLSDDIRRAAAISGDRLSSETIRAACRYGLNQVFK
jgi:hypothetical protein